MISDLSTEEVMGIEDHGAAQSIGMQPHVLAAPAFNAGVEIKQEELRLKEQEEGGLR